MQTRDHLQQRIQEKIQPVVEATVAAVVRLILAGLLTWPFIWLWWRLSVSRGPRTSAPGYGPGARASP